MNPTTATPFARNQCIALRLDDDDKRPGFMKEAHRKLILEFPSASHPENDPAPPYNQAPKPRHCQAWLVSGSAAICQALRDPKNFSNVPYGEIGGSSFMLAMDPSPGQPDGDLHARQRAYADALMKWPQAAHLERLCVEAMRQACVAGLQRDGFDLAALAEQAALRYCLLGFGYGSRDLALLQQAAGAGYRALVHQIVGRHFSDDPTVLPLARQAMGLLTQRSSALIEAYRRVKWKPRTIHSRLLHKQNQAHWPEGVEPPSEWGLADIGAPWLQRMALEPGDFSVQELATMAVGLIVGTVGNVQASVCLVLRQFFDDSDALAAAKAAAWQAELDLKDRKRTLGGSHPLSALVGAALARTPPVAFLPRRARHTNPFADQLPGGERIRAGDDILLWLAAAGLDSPKQNPPPQAGTCAHALPFGLQELQHPATHGCVGAAPARALVTAIAAQVLRLSGIAEQLDGYTGRRVALKQRWGFACNSYPFTHERFQHLKQQPLNVLMRVKSPVDVHAEALRLVIRLGAPRIDRALLQARHVHFAWFELLDQGRLLVLHTVYDGDFDAYIQDFALKIDDMFDQLFEHVEGGPPLPVSENPGAFVDVIRACNGAPAEGYFFSAYPRIETPQAQRLEEGES